MNFLSVKCAKCHNMYRAYRVSPDATTINHCMYCGHPNPNVELDSEWDVLDILAHEYNCTTGKIRRALSIWEDEVHEAIAAGSKPITFREFMYPSSPEKNVQTS